MYHVGDLLAQLKLEQGETEKQLILRDILPIGKIDVQGEACRVFLSVTGEKTDFTEVKGSGFNQMASVLKIEGTAPVSVRFYVGEGWWAEADRKYTAAFHRKSGWTGGDGINSFNLKDGNDAYGADTDSTMFIFGDTLVGEVDTDTDERIQPVDMPNNTYAMMGKNLQELQFVVPKDAEGKTLAVLEPSPAVSDPGDWFWLQDGVVVGQTLYLSPLVMKMDTTKPEGFQFKIGGIAMAAVPLQDGKPLFEQARQYRTRLYARKDGFQYVGGIAYMPYTEQAGWQDGDGYIYVYGYRSQLEVYRNCQLIAGRVRPEEFENESRWRWYDGKGWNGTDITEAMPLLDHVSCEMSVMPIRAGRQKGKFLAVFQYDVQSSYVAYSVGETPAGPFEPAKMVWLCDENRRIDPTAYMYNAKAHCHLSEPDSILASYNVNTPSMEINYRFGTIYRPRFIRLHSTSV